MSTERITLSQVLGPFAVLTILLIAVSRGLSSFAEVDLWWHLREGQRILGTGQLRERAVGAVFADIPYTATQWLPEVVTAWLYEHLGMGAVLWLRAVCVIAVVVAVYAAARQSAGRLAASVAAALTVLAASAGLNPRPQLLSFVFFAVTVAAWARTARDHRPRWWLLAVFWVWACCHGLWITGIAVGFLTLVALALDPRARLARSDARRLGALVIGCGAVVGITPLGPSLLFTPFQVAQNASWIAEEWAPTPLNNAVSLTALLMVLGTALLWVARPQRRPLWQLAMLGMSLFCTLWMWRLVPLGAILAAPLLASAIQGLLPAEAEQRTHVGRRWLLGATAGAVISVSLLASGHLGRSAQQYPGDMGRVDTALAALPAGTVVLNDFGLSGWLLWAHPGLEPVADLRVEIYSPDHLRDYIQTEQVRPGWYSLVERTSATVAVLQDNAPLADALTHRKGWATVATDNGFVLLHAPRATR